MSDECRIENVDGTPILLRGGGPVSDADRLALAQLVNVAKRKYIAEYGEPRCEKTDLYVSQCAHCRPPAAEPAVVAVSAPFQANWPSECVALCDRSIQAGDIIVRADGGGYAHKECVR